MTRGFRLTLCLLLAAALTIPAPSLAQVLMKYFSAASTNSTLIRAGKVTLRGVVLVNTTGVVYYLKLYNKATAPTCGTDIPLATLAAPFATGQNVTSPSFGGNGIVFPQGLGFCITGGFADNDVTVAATGVIVNFSVE